MKNSWKQKFFIIYAGQAFSIIGSAAVQFAIVWYLTLQTESAMILTTAAIIGFLPSALLGPFAGVWIDRYNRRTVMICADGLVALSSIVLGAAFLMMKHPPIPFIYAILFIRGIGTTFHTPAMQAAVPMLVPKDQLTKAGGWGSFITSGSNMLGPLLGAFLMGAISIEAIMLVDIMGAAFAIVCLLFVKIPDIPKTEKQVNFWQEVRQGVRALKDNKLLRAALPQIVCVGILYFPLSSLFPLLVLTHYNGGAMHNGFVDVSFALGMLLSSIFLGLWGGTKKRLLMVSCAIIIMGIATVIIGMLPASLFLVCVLFTFVMGNTAAFFNVPFYAYVQESTVPQDMGKVMSLLMTVFTIANPVGLALSGPISEITGVSKWFLFSGIALIGMGIICFLRTRSPEIEYLTNKSRMETFTNLEGNDDN